MVPAGQTTELVVEDVWPEMSRGDLIVDGGNANYKDSQRRAAALRSAGLHFVDCGVSGGVWGLEHGYALMFGGSAQAARMLAPYARILAPAPDRGWLHCGPAGSGHFVKMIHNGIEYGMMQAMAEGFALLEGKQEFGLDLAAIAEAWRHGSVVRSWLLDLTAEFLANDAKLADVAPFVADSGEGRWTVSEAVEQGMSAPVLALALMSRFDSQGKADFAHKHARDDAQGLWRASGEGRRRKRVIVVVMGVCGCGKSTVGAALAQSLQWPFLDADDFHPAGECREDGRRHAAHRRGSLALARSRRGGARANPGSRRARGAGLLGAEAGVSRSARARGRRALRPSRGRLRNDRVAPRSRASIATCRRRCSRASSRRSSRPPTRWRSISANPWKRRSQRSAQATGSPATAVR